jgi:hypothetical protein
MIHIGLDSFRVELDDGEAAGLAVAASAILQAEARLNESDSGLSIPAVGKDDAVTMHVGPATGIDQPPVSEGVDHLDEVDGGIAPVLEVESEFH